MTSGLTGHEWGFLCMEPPAGGWLQVSSLAIHVASLCTPRANQRPGAPLAQKK